MNFFSRTLTKVVVGLSTAAVLAACGSGSSSDGDAGAAGSISVPKVSDEALDAVLLDAFGVKTDPASLDPTLLAASKTAAQPITPDQKALLLECFKALGVCDLGRDGITIGVAEPNIKQSAFREVSVAGLLLQAIQTPEVGKVIITDGRGDLQASLANFSSLVTQNVDAIMGNFDFAASMGGVAKQAKAAGIPVISIAQPLPGVEFGDGQWTMGLDACQSGTSWTESAIKEAGGDTGTIGLYTGPQGNPFAALWLPCAEKAAKKAGWKTTLGYTQWSPQGMEQAASQLIASGKKVDALVSDLALSPGFMDKLLDSGQSVPVTAGASYTKQQVDKCLSDAKFRCVFGTSIGLVFRAAVTAAVMLDRGQDVTPDIKFPQNAFPVADLAKQVDLDKLPETGQFNVVFTPELQNELFAGR